MTKAAFVPTRQDLERFYGAAAQPVWIEAFTRLAPVLCAHYEIDRRRWVHFAGQIGAETDGLRLSPMVENMRFTTTKRIIEVYDYRLRLALQKDAEIKAEYGSVVRLADACRNNPVFLADVVYGGREGTPWMQGHLYIGRGLTQITHKDNYQAIGVEMAKQPGIDAALDLVRNPQLLEQPEYGVRAAFADWAIKGMARWADADDVESVSALLNAGSPSKKSIVNNMAGRKRWTAKAKVVWSDDREEAIAQAVPVPAMLQKGAKGPEVRALQDQLVKTGYSVGSADGEYGLLTERAVRLFQSEHGLEDDGIAGPRTLKAISESAAAQIPTRAAMTSSDLIKRGSVSTWAARQIKRTAKVVGGTATGAAADVVTTGGQNVTLVLDTASQLRSVATQGSELLEWALSPTGLCVVGIVAVAGGLYWLANQIETEQVEDAQTLGNLAR